MQTPDDAALASDIAATGLPTVVLTEGGYAVDNLGDNLASFLSGFKPYNRNSPCGPFAKERCRGV